MITRVAKWLAMAIVMGVAIIMTVPMPPRPAKPDPPVPPA